MSSSDSSSAPSSVASPAVVAVPAPAPAPAKRGRKPAVADGSAPAPAPKPAAKAAAPKKNTKTQFLEKLLELHGAIADLAELIDRDYGKALSKLAPFDGEPMVAPHEEDGIPEAL